MCQDPSMKPQIFISAGHGGKDPGAVANNTTERDEIAKLLEQVNQRLVLEDWNGLAVHMVPEPSKVADAVKYINQHADKERGDMAIEYHLNSNKGTPGRGVETWYGWREMALKVQEAAVKVLGTRDRGVKDGTHLYFNRATNVPSSLIELGFINNKDDLARVREHGASAIVETIKVLASPETNQPSTGTSSLEDRVKRLEQMMDETMNTLVMIAETVIKMKKGLR